jgi:hypothetical protein
MTEFPLRPTYPLQYLIMSILHYILKYNFYIGLSLLPHTAEADTHTHQLICALHYPSICQIFRGGTIGNPRMILIRFKEASEEFRMTNA